MTTPEELFQELRYEIGEDDDSPTLFKGVTIIRRFVAEKCAELSEEISQLRTRWEIAELEKATIKYRLNNDMGVTGDMTSFNWSKQQYDEAMEKIAELKKKLK